MSGEPVFYYFDGRGLGEIVRLSMAIAGIKFKEVLVTKFEQTKKLLDEGLLPFKQYPLLQIDGLDLVQSKAMVNYVVTKAGLVGDSPQENARIDMLSEAAYDYHGGFLSFGFQDDAPVKTKIESKLLPRYLPVYEKVLSENKSGYLVGSKLTKADIWLLQALLETVDYFTETTFKEYPAVQAFYKRMLQKERVAYYIANIRKRPNDERYIRDVKETIPWIFEK